FADREAGVIEANFEAKKTFHNSVGNIQGGILVAMLDDLMGYALGITLPKTQFAPTANMNISFLRPVSTGLVRGKGMILKNDGDVFHLSSKLYNEAGDVIAAATARAKLGNKLD
ncbi:MAG: PaaI family thioesterase, partial [Pseudomonadales bacterium]|nr:PaaI family thioesterase [Pseudomonadales bacterium]